MNQFHPIKFEVNEGETERQTNSHKRKRTKYRSSHKRDVLKSFAILQNFKKASFFIECLPWLLLTVDHMNAILKNEDESLFNKMI